MYEQGKALKIDNDKDYVLPCSVNYARWRIFGIMESGIYGYGDGNIQDLYLQRNGTSRVYVSA